MVAYSYGFNDPIRYVDPWGLRGNDQDTFRLDGFLSGALEFLGDLNSITNQDVLGALGDTTIGSLREMGARRVDAFIVATGVIPEGRDLFNVSVNPVYRALDKCSGQVTGFNALECAEALLEVGDIALVSAGVARAIRSARLLTRAEASLIDDLIRQGIKVSPDDVLRIGRARSGQVVFLETGNSRAGLLHILEVHGDDFVRRGVSGTEIADLVFEAAVRGRIVGLQGSRPIYEVVFNGQTHRVAVQTGSNGFIVGANPA